MGKSPDQLEFSMGSGPREIDVQLWHGETPFRNFAGNASVVENGGNVSVEVAGRTIRKFKIGRVRLGKPLHDRAQFVIKKSMDAIVEKFGGSLRDTVADDFIIVFDLDFVIRDPSPDLAIASVLDALEIWSYDFPGDSVDMLTEKGDKGYIAKIGFDAIVGGPASLDFAALRAAVSRKHQANLRDLLLEVLSERADDEPASDGTRWLPSVVAVPFELIDNQREVSDKFRKALVTFESVVRLLAALALSPVHGENSRERLAQVRNEFGKPKPTIGDYVSLVRRRLEAVRGFLPNTIGALQSKSGKRSGLGRFLFDDFANMRNRLHGHASVPMPSSAYVGPYQELREHIDVLLDVLGEDTRRLPLVVRTDMDFVQGSSSFDYTLTELWGASVGLPRQRVVSADRLESDTVYLWNAKTNDFVLMDPLVRYLTCPQCGFEEAFVLDHFDPEKAKWISFRANHSISQPI
ncbi:MAG: hypothetical protein IH959_00440 [Chloroflexi bacterium]|nr:hypothetical protein [Chloroflexota bacterium]